ncbi:MAG: glycosyltransferase [Buchananella hordeovulneris]|nr:glycosyltransferase [Buchananella hordeovulneris]
MHVLWLPSWFPAFAGDTAGSFFAEQAESLAGAGMRVGVLAPRAVNLTLPSATPVRLSWENGVQVARFAAPQVIASTRALSTRWAAAATENAFAAYVRAQGMPDVLHAHSLYPGAFFAARLARRHGIPFVYTEHRSLMHIPVRSRLGRISERAIVAAASARTAVSVGLAQHLEERFGPACGAWGYTPNLLPLGDDVAGQPPGNATAHGSGPVVGHLSLLGEEKRTDLVIGAFESLFAQWRARGANQATRPVLRIAGPTDSPDGQRTVAQVKASPAWEAIELTGKLDRTSIAAFCGGLDVFLLPSDTETFGVAAIEALAQGTPVIATRTWGGRSVVQAGDGCLVPIGDGQALGHALRELVSQVPEAASVRRERAERCVARFGRTAFTERWHEIYLAAATSATKDRGMSK